MKIAEHSGGEVVADPPNATREPDSDAEGRTEHFVRQRLRQPALAFTDHSVCFYTKTLDSSTLVDMHCRQGHR